MLNNVILMGRLTTDPELKYTQNGIAYTKFCLAVERPSKKDAEKKTDFIDCSAWRGTAEFICSYFQKGSLIAIEGSIQTNLSEKYGEKRKFTDVLVNRVHFCGGNKKEATTEKIPDFDNDTDLPF
ncbi:MAG: single-stranded DNA-binding protein [Firmicutes bacterium]|nr:single-stranded DNA-binding protein [Bacillota bacterium]